MKNKLRNYALWVAIFAFIPIFLEGLGLNILPENYNEITRSFLGILVLAGIISNAETERHGAKDDTPKENTEEDAEEDTEEKDEE